MSRYPLWIRMAAPQRFGACCAAVGALLLAQGCTSVSLEDAAPAGALGPSRSTVMVAPPPPPQPTAPTVPRVGALTAAVDSDDPSTELETSAIEAEGRVAVPGEAATREIVTSETDAGADYSGATVDGMSASAPRETGQFPNLNLPPRIATRQFTRAEAAAKTSELAGTRTQLKSTASDIANDKKEAERLRKLGQSHGRDVLKEIERP